MKYKQAQARVKAINGFYIHLGIYLSIIGFLFIVDYLTGRNWWFYWPAIGWGVAVIINGIVLFFDLGILGSYWEERKIKELMSKGGE